MHRLLAEVRSYFADLARTSIRAWRDFFFSPADPTRLGLIRIVVGALVVWDLLTLAPDLRDYLGSDGWISREAVREYFDAVLPGAWSFWLLVPDAWLTPAWAVCVIIALLFTLGVASRTTAVLTWAIAVSTARRAPVTLFGFDQMNATWILYLAVSGASGQTWSLDSLIARRRARQAAGPGRAVRDAAGDDARPVPTVSANLGIRLLQVHLAIVYGSAGLSKLMGPEWWNGTALEMILLTPEFRRLDPTWFLAHPWVLQLATHAGLALEVLYPVLIWIRPLRPLVLGAVILMHLCIDQMLGLTEFGLTMIAANVAFLTPIREARPSAGEIPAPPPPPRRRRPVAGAASSGF